MRRAHEKGIARITGVAAGQGAQKRAACAAQRAAWRQREPTRTKSTCVRYESSSAAREEINSPLCSSESFLLSARPLAQSAAKENRRRASAGRGGQRRCPAACAAADKNLRYTEPVEGNQLRVYVCLQRPRPPPQLLPLHCVSSLRQFVADIKYKTKRFGFRSKFTQQTNPEMCSLGTKTWEHESRREQQRLKTWEQRDPTSRLMSAGTRGRPTEKEGEIACINTSQHTRKAHEVAGCRPRRCSSIRGGF